MANRYDSYSSTFDLDARDMFFVTMVQAVGNEEYTRILEEENKIKRRRAKAKNRDRDAEHNRRRFRMTKDTFLRISNDLKANYEFFQLKTDAIGKRGFIGSQKCAVVVQLMSRGFAVHAIDEYLRMSSRTASESMYLFCEYLFELYGHIYLRKTTCSNVEQLYAAHDVEHGRSGMLGNLDYTDWDYNVPKKWKGHCTRGFHGKVSDVPFVVNETEYPRDYVLTDDIYPRLLNFVKEYQHPKHDMLKLFTKYQELARKDVEHTFGVLKKKWHIVANPSRVWYFENICKVIYGFLILRNMIIEEKGRAICAYHPDQIENLPTLYVSGTSAYLSRVIEIHNQEASYSLRHDLAEYVYNNANDETDNDN